MRSPLPRTLKFELIGSSPATRSRTRTRTLGRSRCSPPTFKAAGSLPILDTQRSPDWPHTVTATGPIGEFPVRSRDSGIAAFRARTVRPIQAIRPSGHERPSCQKPPTALYESDDRCCAPNRSLSRHCRFRRRPFRLPIKRCNTAMARVIRLAPRSTATAGHQQCRGG